jgi:hypothetical protein
MVDALKVEAFNVDACMALLNVAVMRFDKGAEFAPAAGDVAVTVGAASPGTGSPPPPQPGKKSAAAVSKARPQLSSLLFNCFPKSRRVRLV